MHFCLFSIYKSYEVQYWHCSVPFLLHLFQLKIIQLTSLMSFLSHWPIKIKNKVGLTSTLSASCRYKAAANGRTQFLSIISAYFSKVNRHSQRKNLEVLKEVFCNLAKINAWEKHSHDCRLHKNHIWWTQAPNRNKSTVYIVYILVDNIY